MDNLDQTLMIPAYRRGDAPSAAELAACEAALHAFFRRKAPACDRDDLKQEVWLRLCRRPPAAVHQDLCAYVLGIARHVLCRYYLRRRGRTIEPLTPSLCATESRLAGSAMHDVGDWTPPARLQRLPPADLELLELRYERGLSLAELAARYAIPEGTVKSRLNHTHARLRGLLLRPAVLAVAPAPKKSTDGREPRAP